MNQSEYAQYLRKKCHSWGKELAILRDDLERSDEDDKAEYTLTFQELMRNYEGIESYIDEITEMPDDDFEDEKAVLDERVSEFEEQLQEARETIKDV